MKEKYYDENLKLKSHINQLNSLIDSMRCEKQKLSMELNNKKRMVNMFIENVDTSNPGKSKGGSMRVSLEKLEKLKESELIDNLRQKYNEKVKECKKLDQNIKDIKATLKSTRVEEITSDNKILKEQLEELKSYYDNYINQFILNGSYSKIESLSWIINLFSISQKA